MADAAEVELLRARLAQRLDVWAAMARTGTSGARRSGALLRLVTQRLEQEGCWAGLVERAVAEDRSGDADAAVLVAWERGRAGDESGFAQAMRRAAERGHLGALEWLAGRCRAEGRHREAEGWEARDREGRRRREEADELAARRGEDTAAMYRVADRLLMEAPRLAHREEDALTERAFALLERAAAGGSAAAAARLGDLYSAVGSGGDLELRDLAEAEALPWYRRADQLGDAHGAYELGLIVLRRHGVEAARVVLLRAESRGDPEATRTLAALWRRSEPDRAEAGYRRYAAMGYSDRAWAGLATFLEERRGDLAGAADARREAVAAGEPRAELLLDDFYRKHPEYRPPS